MLVAREELKTLMKNKFMAAGLSEEHADQTAEVLTWSSERGLHSHGEVRVEYYTERISKGGITCDPQWTWEQTGPCTGMLDGDNGCGYPFAIKGLEYAMDMAKESGIGVVGVRRVSHTGALGYYTEMAPASHARWRPVPRAVWTGNLKGRRVLVRFLPGFAESKHRRQVDRSSRGSAPSSTTVHMVCSAFPL